MDLNYILLLIFFGCWIIGRSIRYDTPTKNVIGGVLVVIMLSSILYWEWIVL